jgi:hypothetical protein
MKLPLFFIIGELNGVDNVVEYAINGRLIIEEQGFTAFIHQAFL